MKLQNKDSVMNLGDTSFRRKNLLDDYKIMLQGITEQLEEWSTKNSSQMTFYQYVAKSGLINDTFYGDYYSFISDKFKESIFEKYKNKYSIPYPKQLRENIIERQLELIDSSMPAYPKQIKKAILRKDFVSINHRITEFSASYFDLLFAINEITHPGEKRLVQLCKKQCKILPKNFEENLNLLFSYMYLEEKNIFFMETLEQIVDNIKKII